jgi:hypothetical protein
LLTSGLVNAIGVHPASLLTAHSRGGHETRVRAAKIINCPTSTTASDTSATTLKAHRKPCSYQSAAGAKPETRAMGQFVFFAALRIYLVSIPGSAIFREFKADGRFEPEEYRGYFEDSNRSANAEIA